MTTELPAHHAAARQRAQGNAQLVLRGIGLNLALAVLKFSGGILGHTYALIADGAESLIDVFSSLLVWAGFQVAARPPDEDHPYGHGKAESLAAMSVGLFILAAAGWVAWQAVHEIVTPHQGPHWATLPLLAGIVAVKIWFSRRLHAAGHASGSTALGAEAMHHWADAMTSAAAFVGITIGVIGGKGYETADDWAALAASAIIASNGVAIFNRALADVMDSAVPPELVDQVRAVALTVADVGALDKVRIRKSGLTYIVEIEVCVDGDLSVRRGHEIAHRVKDALLVSTLRISDVIVHIEPIV